MSSVAILGAEGPQWGPKGIPPQELEGREKSALNF